jgi:hypothetical protein
VITKRRVIISVILAFCAALLVLSFTLVRPTNTVASLSDHRVVAVTPQPGDLVLRQSSVGVTLATGYTLAYDTENGLAIGVNGSVVGIPLDELQILPGQNQYSFAPAPGRQFSELPVGRVCVKVLIRSNLNTGDPGTPFSWCFQTH